MPRPRPWSLSCCDVRGRLPRGQLLTTLLLLAGSAALTWLDPLTGLTCLPLLVGALALGRGRTWSVFLMLGGAAASFALAGQGLVHPATCVPAGAALLAVVLLTPALWRFDAPAFTLAAACMTGLGIGAALSALPAAEPAAQAPPTRPTVGGGCPGALKGPPDDPGPALGRTVDPALLSVRLQQLPELGRVRLEIGNNSPHAVALVEPLDGSVWGWLQPTYELIAYDASGQRLPLPPRCSNLGAGALSASTIRLVRPGETFRAEIQLPGAWVHHGVERLRVIYRFDPARVDRSLRAPAIWTESPALRRRLEALYAGELVSPEIDLGEGTRTVAGVPVVMGALDRELIRYVTDRHQPGVEDCFGRAALVDGERRRSVTVQYVIASTGVVAHASILRSHGAGEDLHRCLVDEVRRWRFPQCKCGGIVIVKQPFAARPLWE